MSSLQRVPLVWAAIALVVVLAAGIAVGAWWGSRPGEGQGATRTSADSEPEVLYWYDPMVPDQHFDRPGKSPFMDMDLVPKYADETAGPGVSIAPGVRQGLGIRTVTVETGSLPAGLDVPGTIGWDLRREHVVSLPVDGVVDRVHVRAPYERVAAGEPLASVLAPEWGAALAESAALRGAEGGAARSLAGAASRRVRMLGLPSNARVADGRVVLAAPISGVVTEIAAVQGAAARAGTLLFRINGTQTVWLEADVPQAGAGGIARGTPVTAQVSSLPGRRFEGRIEALLPRVQAASRTQSARIVLDNPDGLLVPGMFAQVSLHPVDGAEHPLVPTGAIVGDGIQARVIIAEPGGRFRPVAIRTGRSAGGKTEVLAGLDGGEQVVASGQFLIDSEASLSGALERLEGAGAVKEPAQ